MKYLRGERSNYIESVMEEWVTRLSKANGISLKFEPVSKEALKNELCNGGWFGFLKEIPINIYAASHTPDYGYHFKIGILPGLCGTMYFTKLTSHIRWINLDKTIDRSGATQALLEVIKEIAYGLGFMNIICTNQEHIKLPEEKITKEQYKHTFKRYPSDGFNYNLIQAGFTRLNTYHNRRSNKQVSLFNYNFK